MKGYIAIINALLLVVISGCTTPTKDFTRLHVGMSAADVTQLLGKPYSVDFDGTKEYWNYIVREEMEEGANSNFVRSRSPSTPTADQPGDPNPRVFDRAHPDYDLNDPRFNTGPRPSGITYYGVGARTLIYVHVVQLSQGRVVADGLRDYSLRQNTPNGGLHILSVSPFPISPNKTIRLTFKIAYHFKQAENGVIQIAFNSTDPESFTVVATKNVTKKRGETEVTAEVTPKQWSNGKSFKAMAILREGTEASLGDVLSHEVCKLSITSTYVSETIRASEAVKQITATTTKPFIAALIIETQTKNNQKNAWMGTQEKWEESSGVLVYKAPIKSFPYTLQLESLGVSGLAGKLEVEKPSSTRKAVADSYYFGFSANATSVANKSDAPLSLFLELADSRYKILFLIVNY